MPFNQSQYEYISFTILFIFLYHAMIQNRMEKQWFKTFFGETDIIMRPDKERRVNDGIGMPSGHCEIMTILCFILCYYNYIPLYLMIIVIVVVALQRILTNMHTVIQTIVGILIGLLYGIVYTRFELSPFSFLVVFSLLILMNISIYAKKQVFI
jgi:membrane-associated phospholipid phosphatase